MKYRILMIHPVNPKKLTMKESSSKEEFNSYRRQREGGKWVVEGLGR